MPSYIQRTSCPCGGRRSPRPSKPARALRPQVFAAHMDSRRSRRFPITVPLHNLRPILQASDVEGLAQAISSQLQASSAARAIPQHARARGWRAR